MNQDRRINNEKPVRSADAPPDLSIVIASNHSLAELERCLASLVQQSRGQEIEVIVADCGCQDEAIRDVKGKYPEILFIRFPENTPLPKLWGAGIERSTGEIIAITDSTCITDANWVSAILDAHTSSHPVIGGAVEIGDCKKWVDWAAYFCEYGHFMQPLKKGAAMELPGNNVSFKRETLKRGREFVQDGFWKTYWCRRLQEEGVQLMAVPSIVVYYKKSFGLTPFLIRRFHHGRCFAGMRVSQVPLLMRVFYIAGSPLLPFLLLGRTIAGVVPKKRYLKQFILSFPISVLAVVLWSIGEFCGYLTGTGKSCAQIN